MGTKKVKKSSHFCGDFYLRLGDESGKMDGFINTI
jgi:hypothetical protein